MKTACTFFYIVTSLEVMLCHLLTCVNCFD